MKRKILIAAALMLLSTLISTESFAMPGYASRNTKLRAGPGIEYPIIGGIRVGSPLQIYGCIDGYSWCEIKIGAFRGWTSGTYVETYYDDRREYIMESGPVYNVPIVTFEIGNYWDTYYRNRPFYHDRDRYYHVEYDHHDNYRPDYNQHYERNDHDNRDYGHSNHDDHNWHH